MKSGQPEDHQDRIERIHAGNEVEKRLFEAQRAEQSLNAVIEGTAAVTGEDFFRSLVRHLATALHFRYAFVAECLTNERARSLAFWRGDAPGENFEYDLAGTPCLNVVGGRPCVYSDRLQQLFPKDTALVELRVRSYHGVPVMDSTRKVIGHLVVMDGQPMDDDPLRISVLEMFAARAGAELERMRAYENLRRLNLESAALLNINRAIGGHLDRDALFGALAECLRTVVPTDRFGIELPIEGGMLQGHILTPRGPKSDPNPPAVLPAAGTACQWVMEHRDSVIATAREDMRQRYPVTFEVMLRENMEALCALPLVTDGRGRGALFFMSAERGAYSGLRPGFLEQVAGAVAVALDDCLAHEEVRRLAARKVADLERKQEQMSDQLREAHEALRASEERFRDLFEEAPIAYVHEDLDSRFIQANRAALRILGIKPEEAAGTIGKSLVADTPENQRRLREAFESIGRGTDTSGVVLELRRKDNSKPIWIEWWSRPDPGGKFTRTMFLDITDRVLMEREKTRLEAQNTYLQEEIRGEHNFTEIVGGGSALREVLQQVERIAPTASTVLILGETGTGKELIARALHDRSPRRKRPLVKVNCGAISAGLVESELFGHVKGAFTGAIANRDGRFKLADGGTIFLDEVGELPMDTQAKLLRVLQEQEFEPIGSSRTVKVNVRVIAATNRDLQELAQAGKFRVDLFYRLNVVPLRLPALRERASDIPLLATFFVQQFARKLGKKIPRVGDETLRRLTEYSWPGNIRELQNVIERAVILSPSDSLVLSEELRAAPITPLHPITVNRTPTEIPSLSPTRMEGSLGEVERRHIESVLDQTHWMIEGERGAAKILKLNPSTLRSRMRKLGIKRPTLN